MGVVLCKGSPLVAVELDKGRSVVLAPGGAGGGGAGRVKSVEMKDDIRLVTLKDSSQWVLVSLGCDVALSSKGEAFGVTASSACVVRIGIAPSSKEDWSMLRKAATTYSVGGAPAFDLNGPDPGTYHLRWDKRGDGDLYMLAAPTTFLR